MQARARGDATSMQFVREEARQIDLSGVIYVTKIESKKGIVLL